MLVHRRSPRLLQTATVDRLKFTCSPGVGNDAGAIDDNVAGDGYNVVGLKLLLGGSFQDAGAEPGTIFSVLYTSSNALLAGQNPGNPSCTASATTSENNFALGACSDMTNGGAFYAIAPTDVLGAFTVTVTGAPGSIPLPFNASASFFYEVQTESAVPEPSSYAMIGLGLAGLYTARHKR